MIRIFAILLTASACFGGQSVNYDAADDYMTAALQLQLGTGDRTLAAWVKTSGSVLAAIAGSGILTGTGSADGFGMYMQANGTVIVQLRKDGGSVIDALSTATINDGQWHHVVGVIDRDQSDGLRLYIDGALEDSDNPSAWSADFLGSDHYWDIGTRDVYNNGARGFFWNGAIGPVVVWNRPLTDAEISKAYASRLAVYPSGNILAAYPMDNAGKSTGEALANNSTVPDAHSTKDLTVKDGADGSMTLQSGPTRRKRGRR